MVRPMEDLRRADGREIRVSQWANKRLTLFETKYLNPEAYVPRKELAGMVSLTHCKTDLECFSSDLISWGSISTKERGGTEEKSE